MSFITLKSESQPSGKSINNAEGANNFINHFNDPVVIQPGDTLELVSCSINKPDLFVITQENNEFIFRRGYGLGNLAADIDLGYIGTRFAQHVVNIPVGQYSGSELAAEMQEQLERNTLLYSYTGTWAVNYIPPAPPTLAQFQIIFGPAGANPATLGDFNPSREEALYDSLVPIKDFNPSNGFTELINTSYTDPFISTDIIDGRSPIASKLNVNIGLESSNYIHPTAGGTRVRVKPVSICEGFTIEEPPPSRPAGRVVTFAVADLGTIDGLNVPSGQASFLTTGSAGDYLNGEAVYLEFAAPDFQRPQYPPGTNLYGLNLVAATAVVDAGTGLLANLIRTGNPQTGYKATDIFAVIRRDNPQTAPPALVQVNTIGDINGTGYVDAVFAGIKAITQIAGGEEPTAFGAQIFVNTDPASFGVLTDAEITDLESNIMSSSNGVFSVGDLFFVDGLDNNGVIRVASVTAAPPVGDQFYFENWNNELGYNTMSPPVPLSPEAPAGWTHELVIDTVQYYLAIHEDAALVLSRDIDNSIFNGDGNEWFNAVPDPVELANGQPFNTSCTWRRVRFGDDPPPANYTRILLTTDSGVSLSSVPLEFFNTYPQLQLGYSKIQMVNNDAETTNPEEKYAPYSFDLNLTFVGEKVPPLGLGALTMTVVQQYGADNNKAFPEEDWSTLDAIYNDVLVPFNDPASFVYGESELEIKLSVSNHFNPIMEVNYLNGGVGPASVIVVFNDPDAGTPAVPASYTSNLRELYYPLSTVVFYGEAYPFNIAALNFVNPLGTFGQSRLRYITQGYDKTSSGWREEERKNMLWEIAYPNPQEDRDNDWNDDTLQPIQAGFNVGNMPIVVKFNEINPNDIQKPGIGITLPPTNASGLISWFDASPGNPLRPYTDWKPFLTNPLGPLIGMPTFFQDPVPPPATGTTSTNSPLVAPRQTIQVEVPEFNIKSWSGGSNDVGRAVGVIPAEQWTTNPDLTNDTLYYKSDYPKPVATNSQVTNPMYSLSCRLRDTEGKLIQDLKNPTTITFMLKEGEETKQQRIMNKAMERLTSLKANNQENRISNANENMPRF